MKTTDEFINEIMVSPNPSLIFEATFREDSRHRIDRKTIMDVYTELSIRMVSSRFRADLRNVLESSFFRGNEDYYEYIRFPSNSFVSILTQVLSKHSIKSFLDVGAGFGDKVSIAKKFIQSSSGIEYFKEYVDTAKTLGVELIHTDALDFKKYHDYDLIYMYHPILNQKLYLRMVETIMKQMKVGSFLLEVLNIDGIEELPVSKSGFNVSKVLDFPDAILIEKQKSFNVENIN